MTRVVALGGNALLRRGEPAEAALQERRVVEAVDAIAPLARDGPLVVTHGNGPQVGLLALQAEAYREVAPYPLDVLGAETEGMIGYLLARELRNQLPDREVATLLTAVEVEAEEASRARATKRIGPLYDAEVARRLARERGWEIAPDGAGFRRVVASPAPARILDLANVRVLLRAGAVVICAGGGGVPVVRDSSGALRGIEAVIDKDLASARLAADLGAEQLLLLTDVDAVYRAWPDREAGRYEEVRASELAGQRFDEGSMGPKVVAALRFVEETGFPAGIGHLRDAAAIGAGRAGTQIVSR